MVCCLISCNEKRKISPPTGRGTPGKREGWGRLGVRGNCGLPASLGKTLKESGKTKHPPVHNSSVEIPRRISAGAYNVARCDRLCPAASGADIFPGSKPSRQPSRQAARPGRAALRRRHPHYLTLRMLRPTQGTRALPSLRGLHPHGEHALSHSAVLRPPRNVRYPPCICTLTDTHTLSLPVCI